MINRAYSTIEIKSINEEERLITGIASTPTPDRMADVVDPKGAVFKLPLPLLWQHDSTCPIGHVETAKVTAKGIEIVARIAKNVTADIDECWALIKSGLVRGLSIGFRGLDSENIPNSWGVLYKAWEWLELSAVTIPANAEASIQTIKSIDTKQLAASGKPAARVVRLEPPPGVSGKKQSEPATSRFFFDPNKGNAMNVQEQIKQFEATRVAKAAALSEIMEKSAETGETLDTEQSQKYDELEVEIKTVDAHLTRLRNTEKMLAGKVLPVPQTDHDDPAETLRKADDSRAARNDGVIAVAKKLDKGIAFTRFVKTMAMSNGNAREALEVAKERYPEESPLHNIIKMHIGQGSSRQFIQKTAVDAALTGTSAWAGALVQYQNMAQDFIEFLRPQTIVGKIPGLRQVPFKVRVPRQTGGGTASWVGEGAGKPLTKLAFDTVTLDFTKIATIAVLTDEVVRLSSPSAEAITRDQLAAAIVQQMDADFIDPDNAGTSNVKPASITNGVTPTASSGNAETNVRQDILSVFQPWILNNITPTSGVWIMSATTALALSLMVNGLGQPSFPGITMNGGTFFGLPVVVSESAGVVNGSAGGHIVVLLNARDILLADDGTVAVDASREASLEMSDAPSGSAATGTGASLVSMFQTNSVAIRAERWVNWVKGRSTAVQFLDSVNWGEA